MQNVEKIPSQVQVTAAITIIIQKLKNYSKLWRSKNFPRIILKFFDLNLEHDAYRLKPCLMFLDSLYRRAQISLKDI